MPAKKARQHQKFSYTCNGCGRKLTFGKVVLRRLREEGKRYYCTFCRTQIPPGIG